ncbi:MAG: ABC transporter permease [Clostridiaceae bacterium]|nr:ABC transporter permease [Clostridiaceae bacterium]
MVKYLSKRLLRSLMTIFIIVSTVFILMRQLPLDGFLPNVDKMSQEQIKNSLALLGLDKPLHQQLADFWKQLIIHGDLGTSYVYRNNVPAMTILAAKAPLSIKLGIMAILLGMLLGLPLGLLMARHKNKFPDHLGTVFIVFIQAVPAMVYYLFIQLYGTDLFGLSLLFRANDWRTWILPVFSLSLPNIIYYAMWIRRYTVDESTKDYVQLAKIKGVSEQKIFYRHVFRNAFVPMVQYLPSSLLNTVVGSIYIESLYAVPGMGGLLIDVVKKQDNNMVQAIVMMFSIVGIIGLILGDLMMVALDPRISFVTKGGRR